MSDNLYYTPEKFGLELVKEIEWREASYEFCLTILWRDREGAFFLASDSGCSCPTPFDGLKVEGLTPVRSLGDLLDEIKAVHEDHYLEHEDTAGKRAALVSAYQQARS